jgi:PAS domain S-box-containing protein
MITAAAMCGMLLMASCSRAVSPDSQPRAVKGVMDLGSWDFTRDGIVDLSGQWEFYWQRLLDPRTGVKGEDVGRKYIGFPGAWNETNEYPSDGFATYRLRVLLPHLDESLGLGFLDMGTAYRVFINGVEVYTAGIPGVSPELSVPRYNPGTVVFRPGSGEMEIVIHVSNFHHRMGGAWDNVKLGTGRSITAMREGSLAFELFLFGSLFIIGLYHLSLFILRRKDPSPLYFGLYCVFISLFTIATGERFIVHVVPSLSWELHFRLVAFSIFASVPLFGLFLHSLFPGEFSKYFLRFLLVSGAAFCCIALFFPARMNTHALVYCQALILFACFYAVFVLIVSLARKREGAGIFLMSFLAIFATAVNDILHDNNVIRTAFFIPFGLLVFIFSHSFILSRRFSRAFTTIEHQTMKLNEMRNYLQNIIDSMPSILVGVDTSGYITEWNIRAHQSTGLKRQEAEGKPLTDVFPVLEKHLDKVRTAIRERRSQKTERIIYISNGEIRYSDVMVYPLIANGVEGAVIRIDDVTGRVHIEEMMVQTEKMMSVGGLAAGMAHEINNPLGAILLSAQNIARRISPEFPKNAEIAGECGTNIEGISRYMEKRGLARMLDEIIAMGERASKIVANMLAFSRKSDVFKTPGNIEDIVSKALELAANDYDLKKKYDFRHVEIVRDFDDALPLVSCMATEIEQVLLNLVKNAAHAMFETGTGKPSITIRIRNAGDYVHMEVEDNGPGMDEETCRRAFEPFFTTKVVGVGTGLGLSVSYYIITKNHNGTMMVESSPGVGAKFSINLPVGGGEAGRDHHKKS